MNSMPPRLPAQYLCTVLKSTPKNHRTYLSSDLSSTLPRTKLHARALSTSGFHQDVGSDEHPRWKKTPSRMTAPFRSKPPVFGNEFAVNEDPDRLDRVYVRILGHDGDQMLSEEVKWLAVTHKSFDHGRRGFNDRLSFLGICQLWLFEEEQSLMWVIFRREKDSSSPIIISTRSRILSHAYTSSTRPT